MIYYNEKILRRGSNLSSNSNDIIDKELKILEIKEYFINVCKKLDIENWKVQHIEEFNKVNFKIPLIWIEEFCIVLNLKLTLTKNDLEYTCSAIYCHNSFEPICLQSQRLNMLINRYFLKLNSNFKYGYFSCNPDNGQMSFKVNSNTETNWKYILDLENLKTLIRTQINTATQAIKFHSVKILYIANLISKAKYDIIASKGLSMRKLHDEWLKILTDFVKHLKKAFELKVSKDLEKNLSSVVTMAPTKILTKIKIDEVKPEEYPMQEGGFSKITIVQIKFKIEEQENLLSFSSLTGKNLTRYMIVKEEKKNDKLNQKLNEIERGEKKRIENEQKILEHIGEDENPSIARYFIASPQDSLEHFKSSNVIIMEYYPHGSLESFLHRHEYVSLNTKLWFLIQIANGLRFLFDKFKVYHLDLKPGNVLLTRNFMCRLIDFGESYIINSTESSHRPGKTFPFAPPEVFQESITFKDKMDSFSYGVIMCEMLFDQMIIDYKKSNLQAISSRYMKGTYKTKLNDKISIFYGPKHLMKI